MAKKAASLNTAYGRKRLRDEHTEWRSQETQQVLQEGKSTGIFGCCRYMFNHCFFIRSHQWSFKRVSSLNIS